jgi:hypothetical protein
MLYICVFLGRARNRAAKVQLLVGVPVSAGGSVDRRVG